MTSSKYDYDNYDQFLPTFGMDCKTILHVSVPNLKSFGPTKTELRVKEVGGYFIMGKWAGGYSFAHLHGV